MLLRLAESTMEEMRLLQEHWMDLRQYIRMVYRMAMEMTQPAEGYETIVKKHVEVLVYMNFLCEEYWFLVTFQLILNLSFS